MTNLTRLCRPDDDNKWAHYWDADTGEDLGSAAPGDVDKARRHLWRFTPEELCDHHHTMSRYPFPAPKQP